MIIDSRPYIKLRQRFDSDMGMYYLLKYYMKDQNGDVLANTTHITLNDPRVFADAAIYVMGEDKPNYEITGCDASIQGKIEEDFKLWLYQNDIILADEQIEPLKTCIDWFALLRGWIGALTLMYKDGDKYLPRIIPIDPRWMTWKNGDRGLEQLSYQTRMTREMAEQRFETLFDGNDKDIIIEHVWDNMNYYITRASSDGSKQDIEVIKTIPHNIGFCPSVVVPVPTQPLLVSSGGSYDTELAYQGESIYAAIRGIAEDMNEWASISASINKMQFLSPLVYIGERESFSERPFGWGSVIQLKTGEQLTELRTKELSSKAENFFGLLFQRFEKATLSSINFGIAGDRMSALMGAQLKADANKVFGCRRKSESTFFRKAFNNLRRQVKNGCYETSIDDEDAIEIPDLTIYDKKVVVNISFSQISPEENITNLQTALQASQLGLPPEILYRDYLHLDNPEQAIKMGQLNRLRQIIPALDMFEAEIYLAKGDATEEEINERRAKIIRDFRQKQIEQNQVQPATNAPSQPKVDTTIGRPSTAQLTKEKAQRSNMQVPARNQGVK